jgi:hypothetical protein
MSATSSRKPYRVGRSRTGLGLFATKPSAKGTEIIEYLGRMLDCRKKEDDAIENKYLFQINGRWTIDGSRRSNTARYINHACRPNAESEVNQRKRTVVIRAIKNIAPGDEINYDYGTEYFKAYLKPIGCKCNACERKRARERGEMPPAKTLPAKTAANGKAAPAAAKGKTTAKTAAKTAAKGKAAKAGTANGKAVGAGARKATAAKAGARSSGARGVVGVKSGAAKSAAAKTAKPTKAARTTKAVKPTTTARATKSAKSTPAVAAARAATATRTSAAAGTRRKTATSRRAPARKV